MQQSYSTNLFSWLFITWTLISVGLNRAFNLQLQSYLPHPTPSPEPLNSLQLLARCQASRIMHTTTSRTTFSCISCALKSPVWYIALVCVTIWYTDRVHRTSSKMPLITDHHNQIYIVCNEYFWRLQNYQNIWYHLKIYPLMSNHLSFCSQMQTIHHSVQPHTWYSKHKV